MTVPAAELVEAVGRHLRGEATAECVVRVLAGQLMLGNVAGDEAFARAVCGAREGGSEAPGEGLLLAFSFDSGAGVGSATKDDVAPRDKIVGDVLSILEWNGTDERALSALEQATKMIYYITEPAFVESVLSQRNVGRASANSETRRTRRSSATPGPST